MTEEISLHAGIAKSKSYEIDDKDKTLSTAAIFEPAPAVLGVTATLMETIACYNKTPNPNPLPKFLKKIPTFFTPSNPNPLKPFSPIISSLMILKNLEKIIIMILIKIISIFKESKTT